MKVACQKCGQKWSVAKGFKDVIETCYFCKKLKKEYIPEMIESFKMETENVPRRRKIKRDHLSDL